MKRISWRAVKSRVSQTRAVRKHRMWPSKPELRAVFRHKDVRIKGSHSDFRLETYFSKHGSKGSKIPQVLLFLKKKQRWPDLIGIGVAELKANFEIVGPKDAAKRVAKIVSLQGKWKPEADAPEVFGQARANVFAFLVQELTLNAKNLGCQEAWFIKPQAQKEYENPPVYWHKIAEAGKTLGSKYSCSDRYENPHIIEKARELIRKDMENLYYTAARKNGFRKVKGKPHMVLEL